MHALPLLRNERQCTGFWIASMKNERRKVDFLLKGLFAVCWNKSDNELVRLVSKPTYQIRWIQSFGLHLLMPTDMLIWQINNYVAFHSLEVAIMPCHPIPLKSFLWGGGGTHLTKKQKLQLLLVSLLDNNFRPKDTYQSISLISLLFDEQLLLQVLLLFGPELKNRTQKSFKFNRYTWPNHNIHQNAQGILESDSPTPSQT